MPNDISRQRFDALNDYSSVGFKQGAVMLDADHNEWAAIEDRRLRALASDILGRATVSQTTPDAFLITPSGTSFTIGTGRLYVDGLLAECHGAPAPAPADVAFDPLLAEVVFPKAIDYDAQPYLPDEPTLPSFDRRFLIYLDVWQREVTHIEQPNLEEVAVGVETSARMQTVWQVKAFALDDTPVSCSTPDADIPGWSAHIAPSAGVLSTDTVAIDPAEDPCELPPSGGYRGLENQTYRVEIHHSGVPGQPGQATFKWARDNGSVVSRVSGISGTPGPGIELELELESLGRDDVSSFKVGDWIEITDESRELSQLPGSMRRIGQIDPATRRIRIAAPSGSTDPDDERLFSHAQGKPNASRRMRARRWNQSGKIFEKAPNGSLQVYADLDQSTTGLIPIPPDGTVLLLEHGITLQFGMRPGGNGVKARDHWIFAARTANATVEKLDRAPPVGDHHHFARLAVWSGGAVTDCRKHWPPAGGGDCACSACVTPESHNSGQFTIQSAVDQLKERGGDVCLAPGDYTVREPVSLNGCRSIAIRGQGRAHARRDDQPPFGVGVHLHGERGLFSIEACTGIAIENLFLESTTRESAIAIVESIGVKLRELVVHVMGTTPGVAVSVEKGADGLEIANNHIHARIGVAVGTPDIAATLGAFAIEDNHFACTDVGIGISNAQLRSCLVQDNEIEGVTHDGARRQAGISIRPKGDPAGSIRVVSNRVKGFDSGIQVALTTQVLAESAEHLEVSNNVVEGCSFGVVTIDPSQRSRIVIAGNRVHDLVARSSFALGITAVGARSLDIVGNSVRRVGVAFQGAAITLGICTVGASPLRVSENEVIEVGALAEGGPLRGGIVCLSVAECVVSQNHVQRTAVHSRASEPGVWLALLVVGDVPQVLTETILVLAENIDLISVVAWVREAVAAAQRPPRVTVLGNTFNARAMKPSTVAIMVPTGECIFTGNRVDQTTQGGEVVERAAVTLLATSAIVNGNLVGGGSSSIWFPGSIGRLTVIGNVTESPIEPLSSPWKELNVP